MSIATYPRRKLLLDNSRSTRLAPPAPGTSADPLPVNASDPTISLACRWLLCPDTQQVECLLHQHFPSGLVDGDLGQCDQSPCLSFQFSWRAIHLPIRRAGQLYAPPAFCFLLYSPFSMFRGLHPLPLPGLPAEVKLGLRMHIFRGRCHSGRDLSLPAGATAVSGLS